MESVTVPLVKVDADLHFLTDWESVQDRTKTRRAGVISVLLHVGLIVLLFSLPKSVTAPVTDAITRRLTPLIAPLTELTQTAPNRAKVNKEFNVESAPAQPRVRIRAAPPPAAGDIGRRACPPDGAPTRKKGIPDAAPEPA